MHSAGAAAFRSSGSKRDPANCDAHCAWCLALAVADVKPAGAIAWPARFLILGTRSQASRAGLPIGFVRRASNHASAARARGDLRTLATDHLRRVRDGPAAGADSHGLWFLVRHGPSSVARNWAGGAPLTATTLAKLRPNGCAGHLGAAVEEGHSADLNGGPDSCKTPQSRLRTVNTEQLVLDTTW